MSHTLGIDQAAMPPNEAPAERQMHDVIHDLQVRNRESANEKRSRPGLELRSLPTRPLFGVLIAAVIAIGAIVALSGTSSSSKLDPRQTVSALINDELNGNAGAACALMDSAYIAANSSSSGGCAAVTASQSASARKLRAFFTALANPASMSMVVNGTEATVAWPGSKSINPMYLKLTNGQWLLDQPAPPTGSQGKFAGPASVSLVNTFVSSFEQSIGIPAGATALLTNSAKAQSTTGTITVDGYRLSVAARNFASGTAGAPNPQQAVLAADPFLPSNVLKSGQIDGTNGWWAVRESGAAPYSLVLTTADLVPSSTGATLVGYEVETPSAGGAYPTAQQLPAVIAALEAMGPTMLVTALPGH